MSNKNKKGFTLIEVLVVIIIFGVILAIVIPSVLKLVNDNSNRMYKAHMDVVEKHTELYAIRHKGTLANYKGTNCYVLPYDELKAEGLLEEEVKCNGDIVITNDGRNNFSYNYLLSCTDSNDKALSSNTTEAPDTCIEVESSRPTAPVITGGDNIWHTGSVVIRVKTEGTIPNTDDKPIEDKVSHYEYYVSTSSKVPIASTKATGTTKNELTINEDGIRYVYYRTVSVQGLKSKWSDRQVAKIDRTVPDAPIVAGGNKTWNQSKTYTVTEPNSPSGIARYEYYIQSGDTNGIDTDTGPVVPTAITIATGNFTGNIKMIDTSGKYIYFRAVNNAGTKGKWTSGNDLYVNTALLKSLTITDENGNSYSFKDEEKFDSNITAYTVEVPYSVTTLDIRGLPESKWEQVAVEGSGLTADLVVGNNTHKIKVINDDGTLSNVKRTVTYTISIIRKQDTDNTLKSLALTNCTLSPTFASSTTSYTCTVENTVTSTTVSAIANSSEAKVSGTGSKSLSVGSNNTINVVVEAQNGDKKTYTVKITRKASSDATLKSLSVSGYTISPTFTPETTAYTVTVPYSVTSVVVNAVVNNSEASYTVNGHSGFIVGNSNNINVIVTAGDGTTKTYTVTVTRKASSDATLKSITVTDSSGKNYPLSPTFTSGTTAYSVTVPYSITSLDVIGLANDSEATVEGSGPTAALSVGNNTHKLKVTAGDGTTKTYTIAITREKDTDNTLKSLSLTNCTLSPTFTSGTINYTCTVENNITSTTVTATPTSSNASVVVNGGSNFVVGENKNTVSVNVTAQNGDVKIYTVKITRKASSDATLKSLSVSGYTISPTFTPETTAYTVTVPYSVTSVVVNAVVNNSEASYTVNGHSGFIVGNSNKINVIVTAGDGTTKTYTITVTREKDTDNTLKSLALTNCTLSPTFTGGTTNYTCTVENSVTSTTVSATANSSVATVSGTGSKTLKVGSNTISVEVTAQNESKKTYTVTVTRKASSDATLKSITVTDSSGKNYSLSPTFTSGTTAYSVTVPYSITSLDVIGLANDSEATVEGSGPTAALSVGNNTHKLKVTAGDGTTKTYTIAITREKDTDNTLKSLSLTNCTLSPTFTSGTINYTCTVENNITSTTVSAVANSTNATVKGTGSKSLIIGNNTVEVEVTAQDESKKIYTVIVVRSSSADATLRSITATDGSGNSYSLTPTFNSGTTEYNVTVPYSVTSLDVIGLPSSDGAEVSGSGPTTALEVGTNTHKLVVTAEDKTTTKTYTVTITRSKDADNTLKSLSLTNCTLSPTFISGTTDYTCTVENNITSTTVTAIPTSSNASVVVNGGSNFVVGENKNTVSVNVTAQNGSVKIYTVKVTRKASSDATLKSITVTDGSGKTYSLSPIFSSGTTSYNVTVPYSVTSLDIIGIPTSSDAEVSGSGPTTTLEVGTNTHKLVVTAGDNKTTTYTVTITRSKDTDNTLKSLEVVDYTINPAFSSSVTSYTVTTEESSVVIKATANSTNATVSGTGTKALDWNISTASVFVTAQSGDVKTYAIVIENKKPTPPVITGGSDSWVKAAPTISVSQAGTAVSGIKHYEYYTVDIPEDNDNSSSGNIATNVATSNTGSSTSSYEPTSATQATGTTSGSLKISDSTKKYIWYRTVSNNGFKSIWSNSQTIKYDKENPTVEVIISGNIVTFAVEDNFGVVGYGVNQSDSTAPTYITIPSTTKTGIVWIAQNAGTHYVWIKDAAGNVGKISFEIKFNADAIAPTITTSVNESLATLTLKDNVGVVAYGVNQSSTTEPTYISMYSTNETSIIWAVSKSGTYYVWAKDAAGNVGKASFTVTVSVCEYAVGKSWEFNYTGSPEKFTVPCDGTYKLEVYGAEGGSAYAYSLLRESGGLGGYSSGNVVLYKNTDLYVVVGGRGENATGDTANTYIGGYNGGGNGNSSVVTNSGSASVGFGASGGGATHIGTFNSTLATHGSKSGLYIVAGGGGGAGSVFGWDSNGVAIGNKNSFGGSGGGLTGGVSLDIGWATFGGSQYEGGTVSAFSSLPGFNGSFGQGGGKIVGAGLDQLNGGGGGYYGGSAGYWGAGGAGGSGYIDGVINGTTKNGVRSGNGYAKITLIGSDSTAGDTSCVVGTKYQFDYIGETEIFNIPCSGTYTVKTYGPLGGHGNVIINGSDGICRAYPIDNRTEAYFGGYTQADFNFIKGEPLYITVGGRGETGATSNTGCSNLNGAGGFNGGIATTRGGGGSGAVTVASKSGLINELSTSDIYISAKGGAGQIVTSQIAHQLGSAGGGTNYVSELGSNSSIGYNSETNGGHVIIELTSVDEPPTCELEVTNGTLGEYNWYTSDVTVGINTSGNVVSKTISQTTITSNGKTTVTGTVKDKYNNIGTCSLEVKVDKEKPSVPVLRTDDEDLFANQNGNGRWHNKDFVIAASGADNVSGWTYYHWSSEDETVTKGHEVSVTKTSESSAGITYYFKVCSYAGLCSDNVSYVAKLDKVVPNAPDLRTSDGIESGKWHYADFTIAASGAGNISGNTYYYRWASDIQSSVGYEIGHKVTVSSNASDVSSDGSGETYYFKVCSGAGLCSTDSSYLAKLNKST